MTRLELLQGMVAQHYQHYPQAEFTELLTVGGCASRQDELWTAHLMELRNELVDLCEGRIDCQHPTGARLTNPITGKTICDFCGKEMK